MSSVPDSRPLTTALGLDDDSGFLSWLGIVGFEEDFTLFLRFMNTRFFQFRVAVTEQYCLFTLTFFERVETYHYERHHSVRRL